MGALVVVVELAAGDVTKGAAADVVDGVEAGVVGRWVGGDGDEMTTEEEE